MKVSQVCNHGDNTGDASDLAYMTLILHYKAFESHERETGSSNKALLMIILDGGGWQYSGLLRSYFISIYWGTF